MKQFKYRILVPSLLLLAGCGAQNTEVPATAAPNARVQAFLDGYSKEFQTLYYASSQAEWKSNIEIIENDSTNAVATRNANEAMANFTGSIANIDSAKTLSKLTDITPLQKRQLEYVLYNAGGNPGTVPELVKAKIKADTEQNEKLFAFQYMLNGKKVSTNDLDEVLRVETDPKKRQAAWEASKEVGKTLKAGLVNLRGLRNQTVQALDYNDYFSYQVSEYNMTTDEMLEQMRQLVRDVWPLYRELHTYTRHELAVKYKNRSSRVFACPLGS